MFAFNKNFIFEDEPTLSKTFQAQSSSIKIREETQSLKSNFTLKSDWVFMTGRALRYFSNQPFNEYNTIDTWALEIKNVLTLRWEENTQTIYYIKNKKYTPQLLLFWVLHTFFPLVLTLGKIAHIFHVSAVNIENQAVLFSAFSGGGKSTLTNYFINKGHAVYGDDTVAIQKDIDGYKVISSYPFHRPYREAEVLGYEIKNFVTNPQKLSRIYRLVQVDETENIVIISLSGVEKFEALYQSDFVMFDNMKQERYLFATAIAQYIDVYKICIPWDLTRLDEVYQAIITHNRV